MIKINKLKLIYSSFIGFLFYWLGGLDNLLICLLAMLIIDYICGILSAMILKNLNSKIGWNGIVKKIITLQIISISYILEKVTNNTIMLREIVIMFFIINEAISIIENAEKCGLPIPEKLKKFLSQINNEGEK